MTIILSLEGNIGSGKSTLLKQLTRTLPDNSPSSAILLYL